MGTYRSVLEAARVVAYNSIRPPQSTLNNLEDALVRLAIGSHVERVTGSPDGASAGGGILSTPEAEAAAEAAAAAAAAGAAAAEAAEAAEPSMEGSNHRSGGDLDDTHKEDVIRFFCCLFAIGPCPAPAMYAILQRLHAVGDASATSGDRRGHSVAAAVEFADSTFRDLHRGVRLPVGVPVTAAPAHTGGGGGVKFTDGAACIRTADRVGFAVMSDAAAVSMDVAVRAITGVALTAAERGEVVRATLVGLDSFSLAVNPMPH
jgi:hypothetical protein